MKGFIGSLGLLVFLALAYIAHNYLKQSVEDQEIIEWSNSLVWAAIGSQSSVKFLTPEVAPDEPSDQWVVSGEIALREGESDPAVHPYTSRIAKICEPAESRACWRLEGLMIGGSEVDLTDFQPEELQFSTASSPAASEPASEPAESGEAVQPVTAGGDAQTGNGGPEGVPPASEGNRLESESAPTVETAPSAAASTDDAQQDAVDTATLSNDAAAPAAPVQSISPDRQRLIAQIQARLQDLGYDPGPVDGLMGPQTKTAIESYQRSHDVPVDGAPSAPLLEHLRGQAQ